MDLEIRKRSVGNVTILDCKGNLTAGKEVSHLSLIIHKLLTEKSVRILLNMQEIEHVDSSGIGQILAGFSAAKDNGGALKLLHVRSRLKQHLTILGVHEIFEMFDDILEAIDSFDQLS